MQFEIKCQLSSWEGASSQPAILNHLKSSHRQIRTCQPGGRCDLAGRVVWSGHGSVLVWGEGVDCSGLRVAHLVADRRRQALLCVVPRCPASAFSLVRPHSCRSAGVPGVHGMQEVRGSSPGRPTERSSHFTRFHVHIWGLTVWPRLRDGAWPEWFSGRGCCVAGLGGLPGSGAAGGACWFGRALRAVVRLWGWRLGGGGGAAFPACSGRESGGGAAGVFLLSP